RLHLELGQPAGEPAGRLARKMDARHRQPFPVIFPLTQLRVGLGCALPTLRNPLPHWGRGKAEGGARAETGVLPSPPFLSIAARSRGGDIGRSRMRTPIASLIALATAAIGGTIGTSPTPRAPNGCRGLAFSTMTVSIIGTSGATGTR